MKQNNYFSFKRFTLLLRNDWLIHQKTYLFTLIGLLIALYALTYVLMITSKHFSSNNYTGLFVFYLMGIGAIIGTAFPALSDQVKTIHYLLTPASNIEKYMVQFVNRVVFFIPLALIIFWIDTHLAKASLVSDPAIGFNPDTAIQDFHFWNLFNDQITKLDRVVIILSVLSMASILFAGSAYFKRFALAKTLIVFGLLVGTVILLFSIFSHIFFPGITHGFNIEMPIYKVWNDVLNLQLFIYLLGGLSWLFFLPLAYFKLKEKEV